LEDAEVNRLLHDLINASQDVLLLSKHKDCYGYAYVQVTVGGVVPYDIALRMALDKLECLLQKCNQVHDAVERTKGIACG
jgi:hypothetical protein